MRRRGYTVVEVLVVAVVTLLVAGFLWWLFHERKEGGVIRVQTPPPWLADTMAYDANRTKVVTQMWPVVQQLAAEPWYIYEYHDEQKFAVGDHYGPLVHVFATPYLNGYTDLKQFDTHAPYGILVAVVVVDSDPAHAAPYDSLHLKAGVNCVHLAHDRAKTELAGWTAYITPVVTTGAEPCPHTFDLADSLHVTAQQTATLTDPTHNGDRFMMYPAAARFDEGNNELQSIGIKCLGAWCRISPASFVPTPPVHVAIIKSMNAGTAAKATEAKGVRALAPDNLSVVGWPPGEVSGWYDQQRIAARTPGGGLKPSTLWASLVPSPELASRDDKAYQVSTEIHAATVWLQTDPDTSSDFHKKWQFRAGANRLMVKRDSNGNWSGYIEQAGTLNHIALKKITQHPHYDVAIPGSARWKWDFEDELIWFDCGAGSCCEVDMK